MDYSFFEKQNYLHLKELADELEIKKDYKNKKELISLIILFYNNYEKTDDKYKLPRRSSSSIKENEEEEQRQRTTINKEEKYTIIKQLGDAGKEGVTFLVERKKDKNGAE